MVPTGLPQIPSNVSWSSARHCGKHKKVFWRRLTPVLAEEFQPLSAAPYIVYTSYLHARLARDPEVRRHYDRYMQMLTGPGARHVWFWKLSIYLPLPVFDFAVNLLIRQSWLKQVVSRFKKMS